MKAFILSDQSGNELRVCKYPNSDGTIQVEVFKNDSFIYAPSFEYELDVDDANELIDILKDFVNNQELSDGRVG